MKSLWNENRAKQFKTDLLKLRVYTSRLIGQEADLVLHGGGNTSVKIREKNLFGEEEDILYVKGSGWDLATIEEAGFAPVRLKVLLQMAELERLTDPDMVKYQRAAMTNPYAPNPSVEAILHAIIPFAFVDHTHADAVVTITNTADGHERIREIYGEKILIVPYVMPGFILAKEIFRLTKNLDWNIIEGMILLNHGVFTFNNDPKVSYEKMIEIVSQSENYLKEKEATIVSESDTGKIDPLRIARIRQAVSKAWAKPILAQSDNSKTARAFSDHPGMENYATRGPLTPDHIIRTKRIPVILKNDPATDIENYMRDYRAYFDEFNDGSLQCLDLAPRWAVSPGHGTMAFGPNLKFVKIIRDINEHTMRAIRQAEILGGWHALPAKDLFELEYWVLEQAKLKKGGSPPPFEGKIALVTGAANGIGKACAEKLLAEGGVVSALDINPEIKTTFDKKEVMGIECDVTDGIALTHAVEQTVAHFGGLDLVISNAGIFPKSMSIEEMDPDTWDKSLSINLSSHRRLFQLCLPYLELGFDPAIVVIGSKNVPAPGLGASAYSVAKAGLTQLARIAALELGKKGIRVNVIHPNAVYDTGIWTDEILKSRAAHYGLTVENYKTNNVLKTEVTSKDVAELAVAMLGSPFSKTTGAQIPIDGGNERVI